MHVAVSSAVRASQPVASGKRSARASVWASISRLYAKARTALKSLVTKSPVADSSEGAKSGKLAKVQAPFWLQAMGLLEDFKQRQVHGLAVKTCLFALSERLANEGFVPAFGPDVCSLAVELYNDNYRISTAQKWLHPDCAVPFDVSFDVAIGFSGAICGKVYAVLHIADEAADTGACGVLASGRYRKTWNLRGAGSLDSLDTWKRWVENGTDKLVPDTFAKLFDDAIAHLEKATTP
jgi:hypothetical protein